MTASAPSREFFDLIKNIGEARSKQEEDRTILNEIRVLKAKMGGTDVSKKQMQEFVIRMLYCELLGHDASFGHIHAVNMCQVDNPMQKRVGYLACSLLLNADHELIILLVNTIQRDLKSTNHLKVCAALGACCRLINSETLPAVSDMVISLLEHPREVVRKKAVVALHRFIQIEPDMMSQLDEKFRRVLCDKDPSVMSAALSVFHNMSENAEIRPTLKDLVPSITSILKQVIEHRLPREYDYHRVPTPWTQIKLLQILALLGQDDQVTSEGMYSVIEQTMRAANNNMSIGFAIIYECVKCISRIYPNPSLCEMAANYITTMISSSNQNLKYLGVTGLAELVKVSPKYASKHQLAVLDCLEDPDESLKRKTLDLLYRMTGPQNVLVITDKLLAYLKNSNDVFLREELVSRVTLLAERYAPDNEWFINTMNTVFELGGDLVRPETAHNLVRLIAEGSGEDDEVDDQLRHHAVVSYLDLLDKKSLPDILLKTIAWVVGEYSYLLDESDDWSLADVQEKLCKLIERKYISVDTRIWGISALTKLIAATGGQVSSHSMSLVHRFKSSPDTELQERCYELEMLSQDPNTMTNTLPLDASCEDVEVDVNLSFLNAYVEEALASGASPYLTQEEREDLDLSVPVTLSGAKNAVDAGPKLKMDAYAVPEDRDRLTTSAATSHTHTYTHTTPQGADAAQTHTQTQSTESTFDQLVPATKRKWGKKGYKKGTGNANSAETDTHTSHTTQPHPEVDVDATPDFSSHVEDYSTTEAEAAEKPRKYTTEDTQPRALTEREKLAASLFGDSGAVTSPVRRGKRGGRAKKGKKGATPTAPTANIIDDEQPQTVQPKPKKVQPQPQPQPPVSTKSDIDLLGDIFGGGAPTAAPAPTSNPTYGRAKPAKTVNAFEDDLLSLGNAPNQPQIQPQGQSVILDDLLGGGGDSVPVKSGIVGHAAGLQMPQPFGNSDPVQVPVTSRIAELVDGSVCIPPVLSGSPSQVLVSDHNIVATMFKALCSDQLAIVLSIFGVSEGDLANVSVSVTAPPGLRADFTSDPDPESQEVTTATWRSLSSHCRVMHAIRLSCAPIAPSGMKVVITYRDEMKNTRSTTATVSLSMSDMIRPHTAITTADFSSMWPTMSAERRAKISGSPSLSVAAEYATRLGERAHLRVIESIGSEIIAAGVLAGSGEVCLVHCNVTSGSAGGASIVITTRSKNRRLTDQVNQVLKQVLS